jgi:hypothetical protein
LSSTIQAGCEGAKGFVDGFGESGLFKALSNQLDLLGLHLLGSMVLDGLTGSVASSAFSSAAVVFSGIKIGAGPLGVASSLRGFSPCWEVDRVGLGVVESLRA